MKPEIEKCELANVFAVAVAISTAKISDRALNYGKCPDQWVADLTSIKGEINVQRVQRLNFCTCISKTFPRIIIILESPHVDEFKGDVNSWGPARGTTGDNIYKLLPEMMRSKIPDGKYHLVLINTIQFQCSLGLTDRSIRDDVFLNCWSKDSVKSDFISRLRLVVSSEADIFINACTEIGREQVDNALSSVLTEKHLRFRLWHPSAWARAKNSKKRKISLFEWCTWRKNAKKFVGHAQVQTNQ